MSVGSIDTHIHIRKNNYGFSVVETLIVLIVLGLLGFTGWAIYNNQTTFPANPPIAVHRTAAKKSTPSATQKYLDIKEWGVKIPLTTSENDLTYNTDTSSGTTFYRISSPTIAKLCGMGYTGELGVLGRSQIDPSNQQSTALYVKIEPYYYSFSTIQNTCSNSDAISAQEGAAVETLQTQFMKMQSE